MPVFVLAGGCCTVVGCRAVTGGPLVVVPVLLGGFAWPTVGKDPTGSAPGKLIGMAPAGILKGKGGAIGAFGWIPLGRCVGALGRDGVGKGGCVNG